MSCPPGGDIENVEIENIEIINNLNSFEFNLNDNKQVFIPGEPPTINSASDAIDYIDLLSKKFFDLRFNSRTDLILGFENYLIDNIDVNTASILVDKLAHCNCCSKHSFNRPIKLEKYIDCQNPTIKPLSICNCKCRHYSRFICRSFIN